MLLMLLFRQRFSYDFDIFALYAIFAAFRLMLHCRFSLLCCHDISC